MAITKTYISSVTDLYNWLVANGTDFFTSFTEESYSVKCYIGEKMAIELGRYMLRNSGFDGVEIETNTGLTQHINGDYTSQYITWAYKTSTSLVFSTINDGTDIPFSIVITKDNNGDVSLVVVNNFIPNLSAANTVYAISMESEVVQTVGLLPNTGKSTTALCPLIASGTSFRYLPNVYYMPFAQYSIEGSFLIDNVVYLCNGIIAVKDEYRG